MNHYENFKSYEFLPRSNETRFDEGGIRFKNNSKSEKFISLYINYNCCKKW